MPTQHLGVFGLRAPKTLCIALYLLITGCSNSDSPPTTPPSCVESRSLEDSLSLSIQGDGYYLMSNSGASFYRPSFTLDIDEHGVLINRDDKRERVEGYSLDVNGQIITGVIGGLSISDFNIDRANIHIDSTGLLSAVINGAQQPLGQIALADFNNPDALTPIGPGDNPGLGESHSSGQPIIGSANTGQLGSLCIALHSAPEPEPITTAGEHLLAGKLTLSIWGQGYMLVARNDQKAFVRLASFGLDRRGNIATSTGWRLQANVADHTGAVDYEVISDLQITGKGLDITNINFYESGIFFIEDTVIANLALVYSPAPLLLDEIEPGVWQETEISGTAAIGSALTGSRGGVYINYPPSEVDNTLMLSINGDEFFILEDSAGDLYYSQSISVFTDANRHLINKDGYTLQSEVKIPENSYLVEVSRNGDILSYIFGTARQTNLGTLELARFPNPDGLLMVSQGIYIETPSSGAPTNAPPLSDGFGEIIGDTLY